MVDVVGLGELVGVLGDPLLRLRPDADVLLDGGRLVGVLQHGAACRASTRRRARRARSWRRRRARTSRGRSCTSVCPSGATSTCLPARATENASSTLCISTSSTSSWLRPASRSTLSTSAPWACPGCRRSSCPRGPRCSSRRHRARRRARRSGAPGGRRSRGRRRCGRRCRSSARTGRDVGDGADVDRVGPERLEGLGAPVMLADSISTSKSSMRPDVLERHLGGRVADAQHSAVGGCVGERGGELELRPGLGATAGGQGEQAGGGRAGRCGSGCGWPSS